MDRQKCPMETPQGGFTGVWGVFPGEKCHGKTPSDPCNPPSPWGVFSSGLSLEQH